MNRVIKARDLNAHNVTGPGQGGPELVANAYLEGTYCEAYPAIGEDEDGLRALFRQFSLLGDIPSHVARAHARLRCCLRQPGSGAAIVVIDPPGIGSGACAWRPCISGAGTGRSGRSRKRQP